MPNDFYFLLTGFTNSEKKQRLPLHVSVQLDTIIQYQCPDMLLEMYLKTDFETSKIQIDVPYRPSIVI